MKTCRAGAATPSKRNSTCAWRYFEPKMHGSATRTCYRHLLRVAISTNRRTAEPLFLHLSGVLRAGDTPGKKPHPQADLLCSPHALLERSASRPGPGLARFAQQVVVEGNGLRVPLQLPARERSGGDPVGHGDNFALTNVFRETIMVPFRCKPCRRR